jgi:hypothetical protein
MAQLKINRGTTFPITFTYKKSGVATSLVGAIVRFTMKPSEYDTDTSDTTASVKKNITTGTALGVAVINIDPADTQSLAPGTYFYDIKVQEASGAIYKVDEGKIKLDGSPTNRIA